MAHSLQHQLQNMGTYDGGSKLYALLTNNPWGARKLEACAIEHQRLGVRVGECRHSWIMMLCNSWGPRRKFPDPAFQRSNRHTFSVSLKRNSSSRWHSTISTNRSSTVTVTLTWNLSWQRWLIFRGDTIGKWPACNLLLDLSPGDLGDLCYLCVA